MDEQNLPKKRKPSLDEATANLESKIKEFIEEMKKASPLMRRSVQEAANDMDHFYVAGIPVMLIPDVMARINAPSQKHADKIEKYLHDEGFMPEPPEDEDEEEEESWK